MRGTNFISQQFTAKPGGIVLDRVRQSIHGNFPFKTVFESVTMSLVEFSHENIGDKIENNRNTFREKKNICWCEKAFSAKT